MPSSRSTKRSARPAQCAYLEGRRRCTRNAVVDGDGNINGIPLCGVHQVVMAEHGRAAAAAPSHISELLTDVLNGRRPTKEQVARAFEDLMGGGVPVDRLPPNLREFWDAMNASAGQQAHTGTKKSAGARDSREPDRTSQPSEKAVARQVLGFGPSEVITPEALRQRHRELAKRWHPDRQPEAKREAATRKMQEINAAMDVLSA